jgi:hypothetical protein
MRHLMRRLITALLARGDCDVHLVPHVLAPHLPVDDDGAAADRLKAAYPALQRHPDFTSASDAKSFISGLDFLIGARMHATIAAFSSGVPVVPISYSRKFEGLYGALGYMAGERARHGYRNGPRPHNGRAGQPRHAGSRHGRRAAGHHCGGP